MTSCSSNCVPVSCLLEWWRNSSSTSLSIATVLIFFATFLPRILVRLVIFTLTKLPFIRQIATDFRTHCTRTSAYLISASLVLLALSISSLIQFFCNFPRYIWGIFFLAWFYSLFNVVESLAIRRFDGPERVLRSRIEGSSRSRSDEQQNPDETSRRMVISESIKISRLTMMLVIALSIYSSILGDQALLKYSVLGVIGLAIALGFVPSFHNVVGGLFLAFNSQFKLDDFIKVGKTKGFVHQVRLRYTTLITMEGTQTFVPNSFFLYKPMINYSQRPKRNLDIRLRVACATSVEKLQECIQKVEMMLHTLYVGLTSHEENKLDLLTGDRWENYSFVAMEKLFEIRVYCYVEELDPRKYAMIRSEVWLAVMEIMEELEIEVLATTKAPTAYDSMGAEIADGGDIIPENDDASSSPFTSTFKSIVGIEQM